MLLRKCVLHRIYVSLFEWSHHIAKLAKLAFPLQRDETQKLNFLVHVLQVYERIKLEVYRLTNMHQKLEKRQQI